VTAGVYLIFRFRDTLYLLGINYVLLILGPLTILIARGSAFYEIDIKKIVALSTLRQLGVIITAMGAGIYLLRFFHLLTHAFFKALLFIGAGNLIHSSERYQDLRVMGGRSEVIPYSKSIVIATSISLCGLPFMSAFYSKEIIIERLLIINSFL
jgi:NADH:ubiquinone oxidoreductase subunit 5 (subunit L)/multisubunit Na+/H+ antiporter MnhA subunit